MIFKSKATLEREVAELKLTLSLLMRRTKTDREVFTRVDQLEAIGYKPELKGNRLGEVELTLIPVSEQAKRQIERELEKEPGGRSSSH